MNKVLAVIMVLVTMYVSNSTLAATNTKWVTACYCPEAGMWELRIDLLPCRQGQDTSYCWSITRIKSLKNDLIDTLKAREGADVIDVVELLNDLIIIQYGTRIDTLTLVNEMTTRGVPAEWVRMTEAGWPTLGCNSEINFVELSTPKNLFSPRYVFATATKSCPNDSVQPPPPPPDTVIPPPPPPPTDTVVLPPPPPPPSIDTVVSPPPQPDTTTPKVNPKIVLHLNMNYAPREVVGSSEGRIESDLWVGPADFVVVPIFHFKGYDEYCNNNCNDNDDEGFIQGIGFGLNLKNFQTYIACDVNTEKGTAGISFLSQYKYKSIYGVVKAEIFNEKVRSLTAEGRYYFSKDAYIGGIHLERSGSFLNTSNGLYFGTGDKKSGSGIHIGILVNKENVEGFVGMTVNVF